MTLPLQNKIFISTRPEGHPDELPELLEANGATVIRWPLIEIRRASLSSHEKQQLLNLHQFHWIVFTSPNGVRHFFESLKELTGTSDIPPGLEMAVIGAKTNKTVQSYGYTPSFVNPGNTAEDFAKPFIHFLTEKGYKPKSCWLLAILQEICFRTTWRKQPNAQESMYITHSSRNILIQI
jgi:uroporphyrinogen-III synthase